MRILGLITVALLGVSTAAVAQNCPGASSACPPLSASQINLGGAIVNPSGVPFTPPAALPATGQVLTATDAAGHTAWQAGGTGSVTQTTVVPANGFSGSVATGTTTPAITLSTTVTGIAKGNGTALSAAIPGTDYMAPNSSGAALTGITAGQVGGLAPSATTDTTNAANITTGTLPAARLPTAGITGGTITNTPISGSTGAFTTLGATGTITQNASGPLGNLQYYTGGPANWPTLTNGELNYWSAIIDTTLGTPPNVFQHLYLDTILQGGGTDAHELNTLHTNTTVGAGTTLSGSAHQHEARFDNYGTMSNSENPALYFYVNNYSAGVINDISGIKRSLNNYNPAAHSVGTIEAVSCKAMGGGGHLPDFNYCVDNEDPDAMMMNAGHYMTSRASGNAPTVASCGAGCSLDASAQDTMGTITEGTTATGFVLTFGRNFTYNGNGWTPHCVVSSPNGAPFTGYSVTASALTLTNASASGNVYTYMCMGAR